MSDTAETGLRWAGALLAGLVAQGVRHAVVSPGSRSTPLALAALRQPGLAVSMVIDERVAGFFALGLARGGAGPVALVATSGSAVANWFPAVVEADMAGLPLLLLSADRPPELQACGANQTMDQAGLFGGHVRGFFAMPPAEAGTGWLAAFAARLVALAARGADPGPVHVNLPFREPLVPARSVAAPPVPGGLVHLPARAAPAPEALPLLSGLAGQGRGAILCGTRAPGPEAAAALGRLAAARGLPVFADLLSGLRFGPQVAAAQGLILDHPDRVARGAPAPDWVLRIGGAPVSRALSDWLRRCTGPQIVVADPVRLADPEGTATHVLRADPAAVAGALAGGAPAPEDWAGTHRAADAAAQAAAQAAADAPGDFEGGVLRGLFAALPEGVPVVLGNSLTVRAADWFAGSGPTPRPVHGNRGLSGIDGTLSTGFGIAAAQGPAVAVLGDLAYLHDLGGLALARQAPLAILLFDNGGGAIFDHLAQAGLPEFERGWLTPSPLDALAGARAFGLPVADAADGAQAVAAVLSAVAARETRVIRLRIDRSLSLARIRRFFTPDDQGA